MNKSNVRTIVFVTGLFVSNSVWDEWIVYFENKGFTCLAPPHPHKNVSAEILRSRHPNEKVASLTLSRLIAYYADLISKLPEKPLLIGHSVGGLIVQLLLQENLGAAGVTIHPVGPQGLIPFKWSSIKTAWEALGIFSPVKQTYLLSLQHWKNTFTNGMTLQEQRRSYYRYVIPESKKVTRGVLTKDAAIDFSKPHPPLLIMAGTSDQVTPPSLHRMMYRKYRKNNFPTDYKEFKDRNHFVIGQPQWKENADYILQWLGED